MDSSGSKMVANKWLIIGLIVSIGANVGLLGFLAGRASTIDVGPRGMDPMFGVARILPELSPARHDVLQPLIREHMHSIRPSIREIRHAQQELRAAILAEPFDRAALESALAKFREHLVQSQVASHAAFVELVAQLTPAERRLLVDAMRREPRHHRFRPPHAGDKGDNG